LIWLPFGYPLSPTDTAKRAPLAAICAMRLAWPALLPLASTCPQSPNTSKLNDDVEPNGTCVVNRGAVLPPSRSVAPRKTR
jgi:hypothetical protein